MENIDVVDLEEANTTGASDATFNIPLPPGPPPRKTEDHNFTAVIKPDLTREEGELTEDSLNQDQQPLFVVDKTGDPDSFVSSPPRQQQFLSPVPESPEILVVKEGVSSVRKVVSKRRSLRLSNLLAKKLATAAKKTKKKNDRTSPKKSQRQSNKRSRPDHPSPMAARIVKRKPGSGELKMVVSNTQINVSPAEPAFLSRQISIVPDSNIAASQQPPPPSPATMMGAGSGRMGSRRYHFNPSAGIDTNFTAGVGGVPSGVYQFQAGNKKRIVPTMGVRQLSQASMGNVLMSSSTMSTSSAGSIGQSRGT